MASGNTAPERTTARDGTAKTQDALLNELRDLGNRMLDNGMNWTGSRVLRVWSDSGAGNR